MKKALTVLLSVVIFGVGSRLVWADSPNDVMIIIDGSGSMWGQIDGVEKISVAKEKVAGALSALPPHIAVGLVTYGHRHKTDCSDIELVTTAGKYNREALFKHIKAIVPRGKTPIVKSIEYALQNSRKGSILLLVSDGKENCSQQDPCSYVKELYEQYKDEEARLKIDVVGLGVNAEEAKQLQCIAGAGGGSYFKASTPKEFSEALVEFEELVKTANPPNEEQQKVNELLKQVEENQKEIDKLKKLLTQSEQDKKKLQKRLDTFNALGDVRGIEQEMNRLRDEHANLKSMLDKSNAELGKARQDNAYLRGQLDESKANNEALAADLNNMRQLLLAMLSLSKDVINRMQVMALGFDDQITKEIILNLRDKDILNMNGENNHQGDKQ